MESFMTLPLMLAIGHSHQCLQRLAFLPRFWVIFIKFGILAFFISQKSQDYIHGIENTISLLLKHNGIYKYVYTVELG